MNRPPQNFSGNNDGSDWDAYDPDNASSQQWHAAKDDEAPTRAWQANQHSASDSWAQDSDWGAPDSAKSAASDSPAFWDGAANQQPSSYREPAGGNYGGATAQAQTNRGGAITGVIIALSVLLVAALGGFGALAWQQWGGKKKSADEADIANIAKCTHMPNFVATSFKDSEAGGLSVDFRVSPDCPNRDKIDSKKTEIKLSVLDGKGKPETIARGTFDMSEKPLVVEQTGTDITLDFPAQSISKRAADLSTRDTYIVDVTDNDHKVRATKDQSEDSETTAPQSTVTTTEKAQERSGSGSGSCNNHAARRTLQELRSADYGFARDSLRNKWVPQISSKQEGLNAEGRTWDACAIVAEIDSFASKYPNVTLLWTDDWSAFNVSQWWVTVVGIPYDDPDTALAWCNNHNLDRDHCYAKKLTTSGGPNGTTRR